MYPFDFKPKRKSINSREIFVVMPFESKYDEIFDKLIKPATDKANEILGFKGHELLYSYRTKDDLRTVSGWMNILEHLFTAQIVLGVLTSDNPNVFYELGIVHATEPITRQILIANKGYKPRFNIKDLIYFEYEDNLTESVEPLAIKIQDAIKWHDIEKEKRINQARMMAGPYEFEVMMSFGKYRNFVLESTPELQEHYNTEAHDRYIIGLTNLCHLGLLGLNTSSSVNEETGKVKVEFSYHWTGLGNEVLAVLKLISKQELISRRQSLPAYFE